MEKKNRKKAAPNHNLSQNVFVIKYKYITWSDVKHRFNPKFGPIIRCVSLLLEGTRRLNITTSMESAWTLRM